MSTDPKRRIPHLRLVIGVVGIILIAGVAIAVAGALNRPQKVSNAKVEIIGGSPQQKALAQTIASGIDAVPIARIEIGPPPNGFAPNPNLGELGTTWIVVHPTVVDPQEGGKVIAQWASELFAGAFRDISHSRGMPDVLGARVVFESPDGSSEFAGASVIATPFDQPVDSGDAASLGQLLRARLQRLRFLEASSVSFQVPDKLAPIVTETTDDPAAFIHANGPALFEASLGAFDRFEGSLLVVKDGSGHVVRVNAYNARTGLGATWIRPGSSLEGVSNDGLP